MVAVLLGHSRSASLAVVTVVVAVAAAAAGAAASPTASPTESPTLTATVPADPGAGCRRVRESSANCGVRASIRGACLRAVTHGTGGK